MEIDFSLRLFIVTLDSHICSKIKRLKIIVNNSLIKIKIIIDCKIDKY
jgi:hypothetical protein